MTEEKIKFDWKCPDPECARIHTYRGTKTTRATTNCPKTGIKYKVWQYRIIIEEPEMVVENNIIDEPVRRAPIKQRRFHSKDYQRSQLRGIKVFLGLPDPHRKDMDIITDAQDIINGLQKFIDKNWDIIRGKNE